MGLKEFVSLPTLNDEHLKNLVKFLLQQLLGFRRYLFVFAKYKVHTLRWDRKEHHFFAFLNLLHDDGRSILDIGANLGIMTKHMSVQFPKSQIHAIEPMPDNIHVLKKVMSDSTNVRIHETALGDEIGKATMILPVDSGAKLQGLSHVKSDTITDWNKGKEIEVPMTTIDEVFPNCNVQGIKMDVENYEYEVLLGAKQLIDRCRPILYIELWDNENRTRCMNLLTEWSYQAHVVENKNLVPFTPAHSQQNFIFLPN